MLKPAETAVKAYLDVDQVVKIAKENGVVVELNAHPERLDLKDSHLMASLHALVGLPQNGPGAHPDNQVLALDGRGKNKMAPPGELDSEEHKGSLCWVVVRTSKEVAVNLVLENLTFESEIKMSLPTPKKAQHRDSLLGSIHHAFSAYHGQQD